MTLKLRCSGHHIDSQSVPLTLGSLFVGVMVLQIALEHHEDLS